MNFRFNSLAGTRSRSRLWGGAHFPWQPLWSERWLAAAAPPASERGTCCWHNCQHCHYSGTWAPWHLKSPITYLYVQRLVQNWQQRKQQCSTLLVLCEGNRCIPLTRWNITKDMAVGTAQLTHHEVREGVEWWVNSAIPAADVVLL